VQHPLADALRRAAGPARPPIRDAERSASGIRATLGARVIHVGSRRHLAEAGIAVPHAVGTETDETLAHVAEDGAWIGAIRFRDALWPDAAGALDALRAQGLRVLIATGDTAPAARAVAAQVGVAPQDVHAGLTPEDKVALVRRLPGPVGFVGDGLNDAAALVAADVGIAASDASAATVGIADIVIAAGGLAKVARARAIACRARRGLRQNLALSVIYNLAALSLAAAGTVPPAAAAIAMGASSLTVVLNAGRLAGSDKAGSRPAGA